MKADKSYYEKPYEKQYAPQLEKTKDTNMNTYLTGRERAYKLYSLTREQLIEGMETRNKDILAYLQKQEGILY